MAFEAETEWLGCVFGVVGEMQLPVFRYGHVDCACVLWLFLLP